MHPKQAYTLTALTVTARGDELRVTRPQPFLEAAAQAIGIERLNVIDTGLDPVSGRRAQWDDGNNALAVGPRLAVVHERNTETISRLEAAGVQVIQVPGSELASTRGGPRCMTCAIARDPAIGTSAAELRQPSAEAARPADSAPISAAGPVDDPAARGQRELAPA
jgi:arginine deiminase